MKLWESFVGFILTQICSCVCDSTYLVGVVNNTPDSLYFGVSKYDNIDSIYYCIPPGFHSTDTTNIFINETNACGFVIFPDSVGYCRDIALFGDNDSCYIFAFSKNVVLNNSWDEIKSGRKYKSKVVKRRKERSMVVYIDE